MDVTGPAKTSSKCPADNVNDVWSAKKMNNVNVKVLCSPDY